MRIAFKAMHMRSHAQCAQYMVLSRVVNGAAWGATRKALLGFQGALWEQLHVDGHGVSLALALGVWRQAEADLNAGRDCLAKLFLHLTLVEEELLVHVPVEAPAGGNKLRYNQDL